MKAPNNICESCCGVWLQQWTNKMGNKCWSIQYFANNVPSQNLECNSKQFQFGDQIRYANKKYFYRKQREWLIFSECYGKVHYYVCMLFDISGTVLLNQFPFGFNDWTNGHKRIKSHKRSKEHFVAISSMIEY